MRSSSAARSFPAAFDPAPTNAPILFGVTSAQGPEAGRRPLFVTGLHFEKQGGAATLALELDGQRATAVEVLSDTQLTALAPPASSSPSDVTLTNLAGGDQLPGGSLYLPAVLCSPTVMVGGTYELTNRATTKVL